MEKDPKGRKDYQVELTNRCRREYRKLIKKNPALERKVDKLLKLLGKKVISGEPLQTTLRGMYSYRFRMGKEKNQYRIIYIIDKDTIVVHEISNRNNAYADLEHYLDGVSMTRGEK